MRLIVIGEIIQPDQNILVCDIKRHDTLTYSEGKYETVYGTIDTEGEFLELLKSYPSIDSLVVKLDLLGRRELMNIYKLRGWNRIHVIYDEALNACIDRIRDLRDTQYLALMYQYLTFPISKRSSYDLEQKTPSKLLLIEMLSNFYKQLPLKAMADKTLRRITSKQYRITHPSLSKATVDSRIKSLPRHEMWTIVNKFFQQVPIVDMDRRTLWKIVTYHFEEMYEDYHQRKEYYQNWIKKCH